MYPKFRSIIWLFEDGINDYEYSFVYNKKDYSDLTMNIKVDHVNQGKETAKIGDVLITKLSLSASSADQALEGGKFKVYFDPSFVDISKVKVPALDDIYTVDIDPSGVITIAFKDDVQGGDYYAIPIEWAFKEGSTPQNYEMEIVTELLDKDDKVVMVPKDDDGNHYFPIISGYYEEPILRKGAPTPDNQQGFAAAFARQEQSDHRDRWKNSGVCRNSKSCTVLFLYWARYENEDHPSLDR